jgi:hypothetical protein
VANQWRMIRVPSWLADRLDEERVQLESQRRRGVEDVYINRNAKDAKVATHWMVIAKALDEMSGHRARSNGKPARRLPRGHRVPPTLLDTLGCGSPSDTVPNFQSIPDGACIHAPARAVPVGGAAC